MQMPPIKFAIIDTNILLCLGLQHLICDLLPTAEILVYRSVDELLEHDSEEIKHYFVSSRVFFEHSQFFRKNPKKTIVLVNGDMTIREMNTLNICQDEKAVVRDMMHLQSKGHGYAMKVAQETKPRNENQLSPREIDVAIQICKGKINKEIADILNISLTTVITHRKNIMSKLHFRATSELIIYCVVNGIVNIEEL